MVKHSLHGEENSSNLLWSMEAMECLYPLVEEHSVRLVPREEVLKSIEEYKKKWKLK